MAEWPCRACTFLNPDTSLRCQICLARRNVGGGQNRGPTNSSSPVVVDLSSASSANGDGGGCVASMESVRSKKRKRMRQPGSTVSEGGDRRVPEKNDDVSNGRRDPRAQCQAVRQKKKETKSDSRKKRRHPGTEGRREPKGTLRVSSDIGSSSNRAGGWMKDAVGLSSDEEWAFDESTRADGNQRSNCVASPSTSQATSAPVGSRIAKQERKSVKKSTGNRMKCHTPTKHPKCSAVSDSSNDTSQSARFDKIVEEIREKDLSSCSTSTVRYNNSSARESDTALTSNMSSKAKSATNDAAATAIMSARSKAPKKAGADGALAPDRLEDLSLRAERIMKETFRIAALRNLQPQAVRGALKGQSQIVVMATGGGKSLCYQLPAAALPGVTIVVAPLIALMVDQVNALNERGIPAALVSSANGERANAEVLQRLVGRKTVDKRKGGKRSGDGEVAPLKPIKLLYCTPELIETARFRAVLSELFKSGKLALFAIDEAHCLSTWGHDFRPAYRKLNWVRANMPTVPCMACTATATPKVIKDIRENLNLAEKEAPCHMSSFNRMNITYEVRYKDNIDAANPRGSIGDLIDVVRAQHHSARRTGEPCSGIVYVHKRSDTEMLARRISKEAGVKAAPYHAGLKDAQRSEVQQKWTHGLVEVAVATVAFGMGIDLPHVRYVLHWAMAKTVEGFYQESGRGGRDGKPALSILYFSKDDASKFAFIIRKSMESKSRQHPSNSRAAEDRSLTALQSMVNFCTEPGCRRKYLLKHFGEEIDAKEVCKSTCDFCKDPIKVENAMNASKVSRDVMKMVRLNSSRKSPPATNEWNGQWSGPHGSKEHKSDTEQECWEDDVGGLGINHSSGGDKLLRPVANRTESSTVTGFVKAKSILDKFEAMEMEAGRSGGFVNFRAKEVSPTPKNTRINVPEHLRASMPDPLQSAATKSTMGSKSSKEIASDVGRLKAELEQLRAEKAARLAMLGNKKSSSASGSSKSTCPAPPSLSFSFNPGAAKKQRKGSTLSGCKP